MLAEINSFDKNVYYSSFLIESCTGNVNLMLCRDNLKKFCTGDKMRVILLDPVLF